MTATAWPPRQHDDGITTAPWMQAAPFPCRDEPELFFSEDPEEIATAKNLCGACPSRSACLQYAREERLMFGVWGGKSADERRGSTPGIFICTGCGHEKKDELRRGKWCGACAKRWRLAGKPASGPPRPLTCAERGTKGRAERNARQAAEARVRMERYAAMQAAGVSNREAARILGVSMGRVQEYARRLAKQAKAEPVEVTA